MAGKKEGSKMTDKTEAPSKKKEKAGDEVAEQEFMRFVEKMDLDIEPEMLNDEDKAALILNRRRFMRAIKAGSLVVDEDGIPTFTPVKSENKNPITFYEPTGASLMAMDRKKEGADVGKMFAIMSDFTKQNQAVFAGLLTSDLNVCMAISTLYLG